LSEAPQIALRHKTLAYLLIDGSYLPNGLCLILYYDHDIRYVQLYRTTHAEKLRAGWAAMIRNNSKKSVQRCA
jgi:hypothetical protein